MRPQALRARFASLAARERWLRTLSSAIDASVEILPFQLEPALALTTGVRRVLLADDVGLGKTIQAAVLVAEMRQRDPAFRALILTPSSLRRQWTDELRQRFGVSVLAADAHAFEQFTRSSPIAAPSWNGPGVWIASLDYVKQPHVLDSLPRRPWDLLVIDEAHDVCGHSERHAAAGELSRCARRVLLLTATPHNGDEARFERLLQLGALPCRGDGLLVFRRTRADVGLASTRRVRWHAVSLSREEERLLDTLAGYERAVLRAAGDARRQAALLLLSVLRKRAMSTVAALLLSVQRRLSWLDAADRADAEPWRQGRFAFAAEDEEAGLFLSADVGLDPKHERSWLRRLIEIGRRALPHDSKVRRVRRLAIRVSEPIAIFTEFKDSLDALASALRPSRTVAAIHGHLTPDEQREQLDRFIDGSASILLATDVASQGLNLQSRCRWIVNLELPWNPARLEQRAGRVDRIGQRRSVHITLLVARHNAEGTLLARLARRTLAAQRSLGRDTLRVASPDAQALRAHLLAGEPLPPADTDRPSIELCRRWKRHALIGAGRLRRQRALASRGRVVPQPGRPALGRLDRMPPAWSDARRCTLMLFSVAIADGAGRVLERRLVLVRTRASPFDQGVLARARETVATSLRPRARRLERLLARQADLDLDRERAIADALARPLRRVDGQAGLFDRRALEAAERSARALDAVAHDLDDRAIDLGLGRLAIVGTPVLELIGLPAR